MTRIEEIQQRLRDLDKLREQHERRVADIFAEQSALAKEAEAIVLERMNKRERVAQ